MNPHRLQERLLPIARRYVWAAGLSRHGAGWCLLAVAAWAALAWGEATTWRHFGLTYGVPLLALGIAGWAWWSARRQSPTPAMIIHRVERLAPQLDARLLTASQQAPHPETGRWTVLQQQLFQEAANLWRPEWNRRLVPTWALTLPGFLVLCDGAFLTAAVLRSQPPAPIERLAEETADAVEDDSRITVEPGDVELERGSSLLVIARFPRDELPDRVQLLIAPDRAPAETKPLDKALDDPVFGTRLTDLRHDFTYRVEHDGRLTRDYRVTLYDLPTLLRTDVVVTLPEYTGQPPKRWENATRVSVVERSQVLIECHVNKPVVSARWLPADTPPAGDQDTSAETVSDVPGAIELACDPADPLLWKATFVPTESQAYELSLVDDQDRRNRDPERLRIEVVRNEPPRMELAFPGKDVRLSPLEELVLEGRVVDDYGLMEYGVVLEVAGREPITLPLGRDLLTTQPQSVQLLQALEDLQVVPDDLLSYHLYALDRGPDGESRRTTGDLFFAEVRPFEETFRQMDAPPGGAPQAQAGAAPQGAGNQLEELLKVQKEIVAATWNLLRRSSDSSPPPAADVDVIREAQATNKTKLLDLMVHLPGAARQRMANLAVEQMTAAETALEQPPAESSTSLSTAATAEQGAYQQLLKLRAREHQIMQGQQAGGGSGGGASPNEQQLNELELADNRNRYQNQSSPTAAGQTAQQEDLSTLNRLKELARRQADLQEKLRELDAALRLAQTEAEREEVQRQLKRLRDEQEQLLRDNDELREQLAQSARQEDFREAREQLEQTRRRMVDATEALEEGRLSQALSSSTRAERDLNRLQQEFREQTSARFAEAMRDLRTAARAAGERQAELSRELTESEQPPTTPGLRAEKTEQDLTREFQEQRAAVGALLEQARQVVQESETAEPLLSRQLYDTLRQTRDDKLEPALEAVPQLLQRGFVPEARQAETQARQALERLQAGVDRAAEGVLGNEVDALKRARSEVSELAQLLGRELDRGQPGGSNTGENAGTTGTGAPSDDPNAQPGEDGASPGEGTTPNPTGQGAGTLSTEGDMPTEPAESGGSPGAGTPNGTGKPAAGPGASPSGTPQAGAPNGTTPMPGETPGEGSGQGTGTPTPGGPGGASSNSPFPILGSNQSSERGGMNSGPGGQGGPISGEGYRDFADRLRDVETLVGDPGLQAEVSRIREQARSLRAESQRHSEAPNWDLVRTSLHAPLLELQKRLGEEVAKRESDEALVPIDRDPVPERFKGLVQRYYERLGQSTNTPKPPQP